MRDHEAFWLIDGNVGKKTYRSMAKLLADHPDLADLYEATRRFGSDFDSDAHRQALKAWNKALEKRGIKLDLSQPSIGWGADRDVPDPETYSEPGGSAWA